MKNEIEQSVAQRSAALKTVDELEAKLQVTTEQRNQAQSQLETSVSQEEHKALLDKFQNIKRFATNQEEKNDELEMQLATLSVRLQTLQEQKNNDDVAVSQASKAPAVQPEVSTIKCLDMTDLITGCKELTDDQRQYQRMKSQALATRSMQR